MEKKYNKVGKSLSLAVTLNCSKHRSHRKKNLFLSNLYMELINFYPLSEDFVISDDL